MEYVEKINKLANILMKLEKQGISVQAILDAELAYDLAVELRDKFNKPFLIEYDDQFEIDLKENDILGVAVSVYEDGEVEYFLQPVLADNGETLRDESNEVILVQDDLMDCIDVFKFEGKVLSFSEETKCDCCEEDDTEEESVIDILMDEFLDSASELDINKECFLYHLFDLVYAKLGEAYQCGKDETIFNAHEKLDEIE